MHVGKYTIVPLVLVLLNNRQVSLQYGSKPNQLHPYGKPTKTICLISFFLPLPFIYQQIICHIELGKHLTSTMQKQLFYKPWKPSSPSSPSSKKKIHHREAVCIPHMTIIDPQHIRKVLGQNVGVSEKKSHPEKHVVLKKRTHQNTHTRFDVMAIDVTATRCVQGFGC